MGERRVESDEAGRDRVHLRRAGPREALTGAVERLAIFGVMGSGEHEHAALAEPLGAWIAGQGVHLLTGGGRGVMEAVSRGFARVSPRKGLVIGVLPCARAGEPPPGYPNAWVEIPIRTHLAARGARGGDPQSRNHINVLSSDLVIVLPGSLGTASEVRLALAYRRPVLALLPPGETVPDLPAGVPVYANLEHLEAAIEARGRRPAG